MGALENDLRSSKIENDKIGKTAISEPAQVSAHHIMSPKLITANPESSVKEVAELLSKNKIGAVPIMEERNIVGIVSESDLIRREEIGTGTGLPGVSNEGTNADFKKSHGLYAKDVMSKNVITVTDTSTLAEIVDIMQDKDVSQLPVVAKDELLGDFKLVGMVSRSDIVQFLATRPKGASAPTQADDEIIHFNVIDTLLQIPGTSPWQTDVQVSKGLVTLSGLAEDEWSLEPSRQAIGKIKYVKKVVDRRIILQPY